ncbi:NTP transferase domain-containing protein [Planctomycetota bacterium]
MGAASPNPRPPGPSGGREAVAVSAVVLAAGEGTRMRSARPKVLSPLLGAPLLRFPLDALDEAGIGHQVIVTGYGREQVEGAFAGRAGVSFVVQEEMLGTGHAVLCARDTLADAEPEAVVVVVCGDAPLQRGETIRALLEKHVGERAAVTVLTATVPDPAGYGRIVRDGEGCFLRIVEESDAAPVELRIGEVNAGTYAFSGAQLWPALHEIWREACGHASPRGNEVYLTTVLERLRSAGHSVATFKAADWREALGVNTKRQLAEAGAVLLERRLGRLMDEGVDIPYPDKVVVEVDVEVGAGTLIHPFSLLRRGVRVGQGCEVGPFVHLREGSVLEDGAAVGDSVEVRRDRETSTEEEP